MRVRGNGSSNRESGSDRGGVNGAENIGCDEFRERDRGRERDRERERWCKCKCSVDQENGTN